MRGLLAMVLVSSSFAYAAETDQARRVQKAAEVLADVTGMPDKGIPHDLMAKAQCVVIVPDLKKAAFVVGAKYGKGIISCRKEDGRWSAPGSIRIEGGSVGFQIGASDADIVLLVMTKRGAEKLLGDQFTLGAEGEVAAGPVGRNAAAQTDARMSAEILSWSRTHGVFAGVSLQGATLRQDTKDNEELYGKPLANREIVNGTVTPPAGAAKLLSELNGFGAQR
ncbi:MAG TPA: lipid-binding SYLF domain-containing protein [Candidatus Acidoferrales bacterium]|nr:lipid-binding SYLF domain-containing protein [Candidatus Acidoferrales bacterium]